MCILEKKKTQKAINQDFNLRSFLKDNRLNKRNRKRK